MKSYIKIFNYLYKMGEKVFTLQITIQTQF